MIFVTVGSQMPFDRLIQAVDRWAALRERADVFAQIGSSSWIPRHIQWAHFLSPEAFREKVQGCGLVVCHAGTGTILTALELGKPVLILPRRGDLMETRDNHQVASAQRFAEQGRAAVAMDEQQLWQRLDDLGALAPAAPIGPSASPVLLHTISLFIDCHRPGAPGLLLVKSAAGPDSTAAVLSSDQR